MKKSTQNTEVSRRKFLLDCGQMTGIGLMSSMINLSMTGSVLAARSAGSITNYRGLVCVYLGGGNDSANMLIPGVDSHQQYMASRGVLGLNLDKLHNIVDKQTNTDYHVNGVMSGVRDMFNNGDLAFLANIGTLHEPMTIAEYENGSKLKPFGLRSHFDQTIQWQTSLPRTRGGSLAGQGWVGRMSELLNDGANNNALVTPNMAPGGNNILQTSRSSTPFNLAGGANTFEQYASNTGVRTAITEDLETQYASILHNHYNHIRKETIESNNFLGDIANNTEISTVFPDSPLGEQLSQVAKYINAQGPDSLAANRQTFFVSDGGYDMHRGVTSRHSPKMANLSACLTAFNDAMKEIGYHDRVVTYTASDFGRSLAPNSSGSDHGWGGNHMVMGGPVNGGRVLGSYANSQLGVGNDIGGRGTQLPTMAVDELHASLAFWFGVDNNAEMEEMLPNIRNFWRRTNSNVPNDAIDLMTRSALQNRY